MRERGASIILSPQCDTLGEANQSDFKSYTASGADLAPSHVPQCA
jgi:hypothetical protein